MESSLTCEFYIFFWFFSFSSFLGFIVGRVVLVKFLRMGNFFFDESDVEIELGLIEG